MKTVTVTVELELPAASILFGLITIVDGRINDETKDLAISSLAAIAAIFNQIDPDLTEEQAESILTAARFLNETVSGS